MDLTSRVVLLTGAKRIGAEIAAAVAAAGADVAIAYRSSSAEANEVAERVRQSGRRALVVRADVSDSTSCAAMVSELDATFGRLDVLVNMASLYEQVPFGELDAAKWTRQLGVDLNGTFFSSLAAVPLMRRTGGGRIVNFADWVVASGRPRYPGFVAYYVAKAGVKALTEALALELAGGPDPGQRDRSRTDSRAPRHQRRRARGRRQRHAARSLGWIRGNRQGRDVAHCIRLHHRRDDSRGRRPAPAVTPEPH